MLIWWLCSYKRLWCAKFRTAKVCWCYTQSQLTKEIWYTPLSSLLGLMAPPSLGKQCRCLEGTSIFRSFTQSMDIAHLILVPCSSSSFILVSLMWWAWSLMQLSTPLMVFGQQCVLNNMYLTMCVGLWQIDIINPPPFLVTVTSRKTLFPLPLNWMLGRCCSNADRTIPLPLNL